MIFLLINIFLDFVMRSDMFMECCLEIQHFLMVLITFEFKCYCLFVLVFLVIGNPSYYTNGPYT